MPDWIFVVTPGDVITVVLVAFALIVMAVAWIMDWREKKRRGW